MAFYRLLVLLSVFVFCQSAKSQSLFSAMGDAKQVEAFLESDVVVVLQAIPEKLAEKWANKPEKLEAYQALIDDYNKNIREAVEEFYPFKQDISYEKITDVMTWTKGKKAHSSFLVYKAITDIGFGGTQTTFYEDELSKSDRKALQLPHEVDNKRGHHELLMLSRPANLTTGILFTVKIKNSHPSKSDLIIALKTFGINAECFKAGDLYGPVNANRKVPTTKTLLVHQAQLDKGLKLADIKKAYSYPVELVSEEEYAKAIASGSEDKVCLVVRPFMAMPGGSPASTGGNSADTGAGNSVSFSTGYSYSVMHYAIYIIDAKTCEVCVFATPGVMMGGPAAVGSGLRTAGKKSFKKLVKMINSEPKK